MIMTGIFATKTINAGGNNGLFYGNPEFFFTQLKGLGIVIAYSFSVSYGIFKFINWVMPMRVSEADEELGLDASQHDEKYLQGTLLVTNDDSPLMNQELDVRISKTKLDYLQQKIWESDLDLFDEDNIDIESEDVRNEEYISNKSQKKHNGSFI